MDPLERPIFIVGAPQSGTTFLHDALSRVPGVYALDQRARDVFDQADELRPAARGHDSNRRTAADASDETARRIREALRGLLDEAEPEAEGAQRLLDGAPRHALRIPFLDAVFPDALFVYVYRAPRETVAGMIDAWRSGDYVTYPSLPDWPGPPWSLVLVPGWRDLAGKRVAEIAAAQWTSATRILLDDLEDLPPNRWSVVDFAALASDPLPELQRLCGVLGLEWDVELPLADPAAHVIRPNRANEKRREENLQRVLPQTIGLAERARDLLAAPVSRRPTATPDFEAPTRSVHTGGFAEILSRLDASLVLTTHHTGKLVCIRHDGVRVNTDFSDLPGPTAVATADGELAVAVSGEVLRYRNDPAAISELPESKPFDACLVAHARTPTGIEAAESLAVADDRLWLIPSGSSELVSIDDGLDFALSWSPDPPSEDGAREWQLTGLAAPAGRPAFVTAQGPRGCVIELASGEVVAEGLTTPRAPRWHEDRLLLLESAAGALCEVDLATGEKTTIAELPGVASALAVSGSLAFVGLSRAPEDAASEDADPADDSHSGVWIVDLRSGATLGYLRFDGDLSEVYDLALLRGYRFPEIAA